MPHATVPSPGLQALILCGPGVSLNTFTSNPKDLPKALIPIANRPMVWYPLDWCHRMGVYDVTLVTPGESGEALRSALKTHPALTSLHKKPDILAPDDLTQTTGTGELLRLPDVQKAITSDFILLPCDLVSELDGTRLLQQWLTLNPPSASSNSIKARSKGGLSVFYPTHAGPETFSTKKCETDFLATAPLSTNQKPAAPPPPGSLRPDIEQIVTAMPTDTLSDKLEADGGFLRVRQSLMNRHGRVKLRMKHRDAHVYVFPLWVKEFVARNERFDSVSEDVVGWWARAGWQEGLAGKLGLDVVLGEGKKAGELQLQREDAAADGAEDEIDPATLSSTKTAAAARRHPTAGATTTPTAFASRVHTPTPSLPQKHPLSIIPPILSYTQPHPTPTHPQPLIRRIDTPAQLSAASLYLARLAPAGSGHPLAHDHKIHPSASIGAQSRVSAEESLVGENVSLGTRCSVKETVIGSNCIIGNNARLTKCVLMEGVVVGDGVQLTSCVVGRRARIEGVKPTEAVPAPVVDGGEGAAAAAKPRRKKGGPAAAEDEEDRTKLTDCEVAPGFVVKAGTEARGEKMMVFDTNVEGMSGDEDEDGDGDEAGDDEDEDGDDEDDQ